MVAEVATITDIAKAAKTALAGVMGGANFTTMSSANPAAVIKGIQILFAAHQLAVLGFVGGSLVLLGLYDTVREKRENKQAEDLAEAETPLENIW